jgi:hypothetical protein
MKDTIAVGPGSRTSVKAEFNRLKAMALKPGSPEYRFERIG